jgi:AAA15 family ATPase/GTPase
MLISFSVKNFRSFATEQTLSLKPSRFEGAHLNRLFKTGCSEAPELLRVAAIYGANAAGKSNLIKAIDFFREFVRYSASRQEGDEIEVVAYALDPVLRQEPSWFEAAFIVEDTCYTYGFSADARRIHEEWLFAKPCGGRLKQVFSRSLEDGSYSWSLPARNRDYQVWRRATRDNALYLSTAVQLNSEELRVPFNWLKDKLFILESYAGFLESYTSHLIHAHSDVGWKQRILGFVSQADPGIEDIEIQAETFNESHLPMDMPAELRTAICSSRKDEELLSAFFYRRSDDGSLVRFPLDDESDGTQAIYALAGIWLDALKHGHIIFVDELDSSLHPMLLRYLVQWFNGYSPAESSAQLIFTTHNTALMSNEVLDRDQVWLFEKSSSGGTEIVPLTDYKPRKGEAIERGYLRGRYGGVPSIPSTID